MGDVTVLLQTDKLTKQIESSYWMYLCGYQWFIQLYKNFLVPFAMLQCTLCDYAIMLYLFKGQFIIYGGTRPVQVTGY